MLTLRDKRRSAVPSWDSLFHLTEWRFVSAKWRYFACSSDSFWRASFWIANSCFQTLGFSSLFRFIIPCARANEVRIAFFKRRADACSIDSDSIFSELRLRKLKSLNSLCPWFENCKTKHLSFLVFALSDGSVYIFKSYTMNCGRGFLIIHFLLFSWQCSFYIHRKSMHLLIAALYGNSSVVLW